MYKSSYVPCIVLSLCSQVESLTEPSEAIYNYLFIALQLIVQLFVYYFYYLPLLFLILVRYAQCGSF